MLEAIWRQYSPSPCSVCCRHKHNFSALFAAAAANKQPTQQGPALKKLCEQLAKELGSDTETITRRLEGLHECNPMMGLRGCRLGTVHPEITAMQVKGLVGWVG